jgi:hypothetical protein
MLYYTLVFLVVALLCGENVRRESWLLKVQRFLL